MLIKLVLALGLSSTFAGSDAETFQCEVIPLAGYGFEQVSNDHSEYVCVHPNDYTDFIIVESPRSEEHTSELQSRFDLVCRLLLEKKNKEKKYQRHIQK